MVVDWDVKDIIHSTCIDTEAANTGCVRGACIRLKKWLGLPVLDLGCRHHMSELMSKATYYIVLDEDLCPDNKMMVMFKGMWDRLDTSPDALVFKLDQEDIPQDDPWQGGGPGLLQDDPHHPQQEQRPA